MYFKNTNQVHMLLKACCMLLRTRTYTHKPSQLLYVIAASMQNRHVPLEMIIGLLVCGTNGWDLWPHHFFLHLLTKHCDNPTTNVIIKKKNVVLQKCCTTHSNYKKHFPSLFSLLHSIHYSVGEQWQLLHIRYNKWGSSWTLAQITEEDALRLRSIWHSC